MKKFRYDKIYLSEEEPVILIPKPFPSKEDIFVLCRFNCCIKLSRTNSYLISQFKEKHLI